jgi:hypothetical protein
MRLETFDFVEIIDLIVMFLGIDYFMQNASPQNKIYSNASFLIFPWCSECRKKKAEICFV